MQPKNNSPGGIPGMPGIIGGIIPPIGIMLQEANRQIRNYLRFITTTVHLCVIYRPDQEMLSWLKNLQSGLILKGIIQLQSELLPWWHSWRHAVHHGRNTRHHWRHSYKVKRHVLQTYQPFSIVLYQTGNTTQEKSLLRNCAFKGCKSPYFYNMTNLCELTPTCVSLPVAKHLNHKQLKLEKSFTCWHALQPPTRRVYSLMKLVCCKPIQQMQPLLFNKYYKVP